VKRTKLFFAALIVFLILVILNCEPEHDNPYDPKSPHLNNSRIIGRVITKVGNPIGNTQIALNFKDITKEISTQSDSNGNYKIEYYYSFDQGDSASLNAIKTGYAQNINPITIGYNKTDTVNYTLDAIPQFETESIISIHEQLLFPGDVYSAMFVTKITDTDGPGDIESVYVLIPLLGDTINLDYYPGSIYRKTVPAESFPSASLEGLIGVDCYFEVLSISGLRTFSAPARLNRIIYDAPEQIEPFEDSVNINFDCIWHSLNLSFPFTYGVEIYGISTISLQPVYRTYAITDTFINVTINTPEYYQQYVWQAIIRDNFGNICKSNYLLFYITH
jgi:hypothetical protein